MRRNINSISDSFEMFLDIICNAFGGIIFIALFLCVMLQMTGGALTASEEMEVKKQQKNIEEIARLQQMLDIQTQQLDALKKNSNDKKLQKYIDLQKEIAQKQARLESIIALAELRQKAQSQLDAKLLKEQMANKELQNKIAELARKNIRDTANTGIVLSVPREKSTLKTPVNILMRDGHLLLLNIYDSNGKPVSRNINQVRITKNGNISSAIPIAGKGLKIIPLNDSDTPATRKEKINKTRVSLAAMLNKFPPTSSLGQKGYYMNIAVWEDSFPQFEAVRDALIEMNYDYNLIPVENKKSIPLTKTGEKIIQ